MSTRLLRLCLLLPFAALLPACQTRVLPTAGRVDVQRYSGKWYEVARVKNFFQKKNESAIAEYTPISPTEVQVKNTAIAPNGRTRSITGTAEVVAGSEGSRLRVRFRGIAGLVPPAREGNYWIIDLREDYGAALVGTPNRKCLWMLSRQPTLDAATINRFMAKAESLGFPMDQLIWDQELGTPRR